VSRPGLVLDLSEGPDGPASDGPASDGVGPVTSAVLDSVGGSPSRPTGIIVTNPVRSMPTLQPSVTQIAALVPNMVAYSQDAAEQGLMGAAIARLRRSGPRTMARVGVIGATEARGVLRMDLAVLTKILIELDLHGLRRLRPGRVVLAASITDVALAAGNRSFFESYCRHARKRLRAEPWLETWNAGHLLRSIREWDVGVAGILTPLNPRGYMMRPDLETCLDEIHRAKVGIWARDVTAGGSLGFAEGFAFAESMGAQAVVVRPGVETRRGSPLMDPELQGGEAPPRT
jgi:hypothetical protein